MTTSRSTSRRKFLKTSALAVGHVVLGGDIAQAQHAGQDIADIFKDIPLTDQYGKSIDPGTLFKGKSCLVLFGYNDCAVCGGTPDKPGIMDSVAAIQKELLKQGKEIPIVLVSVQPRDDAATMDSYVASYYAKGVKQFSKEILPSDTEARRTLGAKLFADAKDKPQDGRLLHLVCPPGPRDTQKIEGRMGLIINPKDPREHSSFITLFENGKIVKGFRTLAPHMEDDPKAYVQKLAQTVAADVKTHVPAR